MDQPKNCRATKAGTGLVGLNQDLVDPAEKRCSSTTQRKKDGVAQHSSPDEKKNS